MNDILNFSQQLVPVIDLSPDILDSRLDNLNPDFLDFYEDRQNNISVNTNLLNQDLFLDIRTTIENECKVYLDECYGLSKYYSDLVVTSSWVDIISPTQGLQFAMNPFSVVNGIIFLDNDPYNLQVSLEAYQPEIPYFIPKVKSYLSLEEMLSKANISATDSNNLKYHMILFLGSNTYNVKTSTNNNNPIRLLNFRTFWKGVTGFKNNSNLNYDFK